MLLDHFISQERSKDDLTDRAVSAISKDAKYTDAQINFHHYHHQIAPVTDTNLTLDAKPTKTVDGILTPPPPPPSWRVVELH